mmetsp:Transcript_7641/g.5762  ORF Transcript_7641/g.5762 Transcript_7641/m.5762 type:complete len:88 (+) Transcript_7641:104-367(+)
MLAEDGDQWKAELSQEQYIVEDAYYSNVNLNHFVFHNEDKALHSELNSHFDQPACFVQASQDESLEIQSKEVPKNQASMKKMSFAPI